MKKKAISQNQKIQQLQQGDVLLKRVDAVPMGATVKAQGRCVLAQGEATGHHHCLVAPEARLLEDVSTSMVYLSLPVKATLTHQEHGPIEVPPGVYEVDQVREYDYFAQMTRKVVD